MVSQKSVWWKKNKNGLLIGDRPDTKHVGSIEAVKEHSGEGKLCSKILETDIKPKLAVKSKFLLDGNKNGNGLSQGDNTVAKDVTEHFKWNPCIELCTAIFSQQHNLK